MVTTDAAGCVSDTDAWWCSLSPEEREKRLQPVQLRPLWLPEPFQLLVFFVPRLVTRWLLSADCVCWARVNRSFSMGVCTAVWRESRNVVRDAHGHQFMTTSPKSNSRAPTVNENVPPSKKENQHQQTDQDVAPVRFWAKSCCPPHQRRSTRRLIRLIRLGAAVPEFCEIQQRASGWWYLHR